MAGDDVAALQQRLLDMGFDCGRVDGLFGVETEQALREFQRNIGIVADGTCGPTTLKALTSSPAPWSAVDRTRCARPRRSTGPGPTLSGKLVIIDPGHGGADDGVGGQQLGEAVLVYDLASRVEGRLTATGSSAFLTRGPDGTPEGPDEVDRASFANAAGADLVISLHVDAHRTRQPAGVATYYFGNDRIGHYSAVGERFADLVQREVCARTDLVDCARTPRPGTCCGAPGCRPSGSSSATSPTPATPRGWPTRPSVTCWPRPSWPRCSGSTCRRTRTPTPASCASRPFAPAALAPPSLDRPEHRLRVHRAEQPLERDLDVLAPGQRVLAGPAAAAGSGGGDAPS